MWVRFVGARARCSTIGISSMFIIPIIVSLLLSLILIKFKFEELDYHHLYHSISKRYFISSSWYSTNSGNGQGSSHYQSTSSSDANFKYSYAVAFQPKDREDPIYAKLKSSLESPTGEDNFFVQGLHSGSISEDLYAAVADGVGGWAEHGYDSSAISRELCKSMSELCYTSDDNRTDPKQLIDLAYSRIREEGIVKVGGTTAIVAHFEPTGQLKIANLGDSWCGVFRDQKLVFQTEFQTVGFNAPRQLAIIPQQMLNAAASQGHSYIQNSPSEADEYIYQLQKDDIIILATDGLTDNVSTDDIKLFLRDRTRPIDTQLQHVADELVQKVADLSKDPEYPSVFAQEMTRLSGRLYKGGKPDDITMVMVKVL